MLAPPQDVDVGTIRRDRLLAILDELHGEGLLTDEELADKRNQVMARAGSLEPA